MKVVLSTILMSALFVGCASKNEKLEVQKKAEQSTVENSQALGQTIHEVIENSQHLSVEQKKKIREIIAENKKVAEELTSQSYKFRSVLIKELLAKDMNHKKIKLIKKNIERLEKDKLINTFSTIEKISFLVSGNSDRQNLSNTLKHIERNLR